ncbi:MAG: hypothetical protein MHPSP_004471, partial [Paramarteilia canceri]
DNNFDANILLNKISLKKATVSKTDKNEPKQTPSTSVSGLNRTKSTALVEISDEYIYSKLQNLSEIRTKRFKIEKYQHIFKNAQDSYYFESINFLKDQKIENPHNIFSLDLLNLNYFKKNFNTIEDLVSSPPINDSNIIEDPL